MVLISFKIAALCCARKRFPLLTLVDFSVPVYENVNIAGFQGHRGLSVSFLRVKIPALGSLKSFIERIHRCKLKFLRQTSKV
jgi:hypothetical protein